MILNFNRKTANKLSKELTVEYNYKTAYHDTIQTETAILSESIVAQSIYRLQSNDLDRIARYAIYHIVVGDDEDYIALYNVKIVKE